MKNVGSSKGGPARVLRLILWIQLGLGAVLFSSDIARVLPQIAWPSTAPQLTEPLHPGDQTRRFDPTRLPTRDSLPETRPLPFTGDMPSRLLIESIDWNGRPTLTLTFA